MMNHSGGEDTVIYIRRRGYGPELKLHQNTRPPSYTREVYDHLTQAYKAWKGKYGDLFS